MTHSNGTERKSDIPISKGISPMAKVLMGLALALVFMQGAFTVIAANFGRLPPAEAVKVSLPPQGP